MKPGIPVISFLLLLLALVGCGTNTVEPLKITAMGRPAGDQYAIHFETPEPLTMAPVVEYTVTKNEKGENDFMLNVVKKAAQASNPDAHHAEMTVMDDRRFIAYFPLHNNTPSNFFLGGRQIGGTRPGTPTEASQTEPQSSDCGTVDVACANCTAI